MVIMALMCGLGCFIMIVAYQLGIGALNDPGPGLMPLIIGAFLCVFALWSIMSGFFWKSRRQEKPEVPQESMKYKKAVIVLASLILYGVLLEPLGFPITTCIFMFFMFWTMGVGRNASLITSVAAALVTYFGFGYLGLRFPPGLFRLLGFY